MAIHVTTWHPDTCGCEINYEWDDTDTEDNRTHTIIAVDDHTCELHVFAGDIDGGTQVLEENRRKNQAHAKLIDFVATHLPGTVKTDAKGNHSLPEDYWQFAYDPKGVLSITIPAFTSGHRSALQTVLDTTFGASKVIVS